MVETEWRRKTTEFMNVRVFLLFSVSVSIYRYSFLILQGISCQDWKFLLKSANILYSTLIKFVEHNTAASAYGLGQSNFRYLKLQINKGWSVVSGAKRLYCSVDSYKKNSIDTVVSSAKRDKRLRLLSKL